MQRKKYPAFNRDFPQESCLSLAQTLEEFVFHLFVEAVPLLKGFSFCWQCSPRITLGCTLKATTTSGDISRRSKERRCRCWSSRLLAVAWVEETFLWHLLMSWLVACPLGFLINFPQVVVSSATWAENFQQCVSVTSRISWPLVFLWRNWSFCTSGFENLCPVFFLCSTGHCLTFSGFKIYIEFVVVVVLIITCRLVCFPH